MMQPLLMLKQTLDARWQAYSHSQESEKCHTWSPKFPGTFEYYVASVIDRWQLDDSGEYDASAGPGRVSVGGKVLWLFNGSKMEPAGSKSGSWVRDV